MEKGILSKMTFLTFSFFTRLLLTSGILTICFANLKDDYFSNKLLDKIVSIILNVLFALSFITMLISTFGIIWTL